MNLPGRRESERTVQESNLLFSSEWIQMYVKGHLSEVWLVIVDSWTCCASVFLIKVNSLRSNGRAPLGWPGMWQIKDDLSMEGKRKLCSVDPSNLCSCRKVGCVGRPTLEVFSYGFKKKC